MGPGRSDKARQAGTLVGALGVGAHGILAQRHVVADVLTFVYVCGEEEKCEMESYGIIWAGEGIKPPQGMRNCQSQPGGPPIAGR